MGLGPNRDLLLVGGLLLLAVGAPTVCFLWFMLQAVENERLIVRQRLTETYRGQLDRLAERYEADWRKDMKFDFAQPHYSPSRIFGPGGPSAARLVRWCDSVIVLDATANILYPKRAVATSSPAFEHHPEWEKARIMETVERDYIAAASAYSAIGVRATEMSQAAIAFRSQARCFVLAGEKDRAFALLCNKFLVDRYAETLDENGRMIRLDALLYAVKIADVTPESENRSVLHRLIDLVGASESIPSRQKLFLAEELTPLSLTIGLYVSIPAELLAARYLEAGHPIPKDELLNATHLEGVWQVYSGEKNILALYKEESILSRFNDFVKTNSYTLDPNTRIELVPPTARDNRETPFLERDANPLLPGWKIALYLTGPDPFEAAAKNRIATLWWMGICIVAITLFLFFLIARVLNRQMKLTRLKNDLIANVSHELKTPVSSIRLLTDTLLEGKIPEGKNTRDYLETISRENRRLSSLIDNFLTFSRMERNKQAFRFEELDPYEVVVAAATSFQDRIKGPTCDFEFGCEPGLPPLQGDRDSLVTALLNLLDNAYKYSGEVKRITLKGIRANGGIRFEVSDNGIGIPRRARKKIFERFYQVDRSLSRETGGTGLGLSIVKFIVEAHHGEVTVSDNTEGGSVFTVKIPALRGVETPR